MKKMTLLTTALVAATAVGAYAQDTATGTFRGKFDPSEIQASKLIGMEVYSANGQAPSTDAAGVQKDWADIGSVNDIILSRDGKVDAVLIDVGGFLGIGKHTVALDMSGVHLVNDSKTKGDPNDFFVVVNQSKDSLKAAPEFTFPDQMAANQTTTGSATDSAAMTPSAPAASDTAAAVGASTTTAPIAGDANTATAPASTDTAAAGSTAPAAPMTAPAPAADTSATATTAPADTAPAAGAMPHDGYTQVATGDMTAAKLKDASVYDQKDASIGEVSELVVSPDGTIDKVIVDVGGFLGIGAKSVALDMTQVQVMKKADGDKIRVYVSMTKEQLKALPTYKA